MSVVFIVVPAVTAASPVICGAVAASAVALGYRVQKLEQEMEDLQSGLSHTASADITMAGSEIIADSMARLGTFSITNDAIQATFSRTADGACKVHVSGEGKTEQELRAAGQELIDRITQQYTYNKVVSEMKRQGFTVNAEEVDADRTIRIHVSRYS